MSSTTSTDLSDAAPSHAQLFVIVDLLSPAARKPRSFVILDHATDHWQTYQIRKRHGFAYPEVFTSDCYPGKDGVGVKYFELASIPASWLPEVSAMIDSVPTPELFKELDCNREYIRNVLTALMDGGIIGETQTLELFPKLDSTDISRRSDTRRRYLY